MSESNKMKDMPVNKLMIQMAIPMILSMALQAIYNIVDSAFVGNSLFLGVIIYLVCFLFEKLLQATGHGHYQGDLCDWTA